MLFLEPEVQGEVETLNCIISSYQTTSMLHVVENILQTTCKRYYFITYTKSKTTVLWMKCNEWLAVELWLEYGLGKTRGGGSIVLENCI
jgi:hypothetical protein